MINRRIISIVFPFTAFFFVFFCGATSVSASGLVKAGNNLGLKAYYSFEDGAGLKATDFSGNGNTGTLTNGPNWTGGKLGKALLFDGSDDFVDATTTMNLNSAGTVTAWFKTSFLDGNSRCIVCKMNVSSDINGFAIAVRDTVGFTWELGDATSVNYTSGFGGALSLNRWYHIVLTWNGSDVYFYLDGVQIDHVAQTLTPITTVYPVHIGADHTGSRNFQGIIDEVRIYNRALGATEVAALYNSGAAKVNASVNTRGPQNGLIGQWSFDGQDISGTTAYDRSVSANDGTLHNSPLPIRGHLGQALNFDGTNYVEMAGSLNQAGGSYSVSTWVKPSSLVGCSNGSGDFCGIFNVVAGATHDFWFGLTSGGVLEWAIVGAGSNSYHRVDVGSGGTALASGDWYHIVVVYNSTGPTYAIYINGVSQPLQTGAAGSPSGGMVIGAELVGNPTYSFRGIIDETRMYSRVLSAAEVTQLYNLGSTTVNKSTAGGPGTNGLVSWHTFDGPKLNTTTSTDSSGSGNHGTLNNGPRPVKGKIGQALSFDGVDDYIDISNAADDVASGDITISAWVKFPVAYNTGSACAAIFRNGDNPSDNDINLQFGNWTLFSAGPGKLAFAVYDSAFHVASSSQSSWEAGRWYHVVGSVVSGSSGPIKLYVDGSLVDTASMAGARGSSPSTHTYLGANVGSASTCQFNEIIDDVRVYNRALSASEVRQLYDQTK